MPPVIQVSHLSKEYRLGTLSTGRLVDDVARWWARLRGQEDPLAKIGDRRSKIADSRAQKVDRGSSIEAGRSKTEDGSPGLPTSNSQLPSPGAAPSHLPSSTSASALWALRDVSFSVNQGEVLGIIGRNGAGKSTLLKILSRVTAPTSGEVRVKGRIASLLEVGTGFHPELTGRENIYLNGAILGMTKAEIRSKFDEIVAFSEVEQFIDTPVKRYSSGMYVRLAFAVAAHLEPEILIVDEVLAVGDAAFQKKCLGKMQDVAGQGRTVLFVSHNMAAVTQLTANALVLERGQCAYLGPSSEAVEYYLNGSGSETHLLYDVANAPRKFLGTQAARFVSLRFERATPLFGPEEPFAFIARVAAHQDVQCFRISMTIYSADGTAVGSCFSSGRDSMRPGQVVDIPVVLPSPRLAPGRYYCGVAVGKGNHRTGHTDFDVVFDTLHFEVRPGEGDGGTVSSWVRGWGHIVFPELQQESVVAVE